jgi:hypothetical protein
MSDGPVGVLERAIFELLIDSSALTTLLGGERVYNRLAPTDTSPPYVIFQWLGGGDKNYTPKRHISIIYIVKALAHSPLAAAEIDAELDAALHGVVLTLGEGWTNISTTRETSYVFTEVDDAGVSIHHTGANYRFRIGK